MELKEGSSIATNSRKGAGENWHSLKNNVSQENPLGSFFGTTLKNTRNRLS